MLRRVVLCLLCMRRSWRFFWPHAYLTPLRTVPGRYLPPTSRQVARLLGLTPPDPAAWISNAAERIASQV